MSRLTKYIEGTACIDGHESDGCCEVCETVDSCSQCPIGKIIDKLANYEDLEEAGRLIELPCKVGDTVYVIDDDYEEMYEPSSKYYFVIEHKFELYMITGIGTWVFLTKAEAEAKLAELEGGAE